MAKQPIVKKTQPEAPRYPKAILLQSKKFRHQRDLLGALLDENTLYTVDEVETLVDSFLKGTVN